MNDMQIDPYPGSRASVPEIIALAEQYSLAATILFARSDSKIELSRAPARLCAIHAIELYLNAFLMHEGATPKQIRSYVHNFAKLAKHESVVSLKLRKRTADHLVMLAERREYLISRYGPELMSKQTELNRLTATLVEVASKVKKHLT